MTSLTGRWFEYFTDEFMNMLMRCFGLFAVMAGPLDDRRLGWNFYLRPKKKWKFAAVQANFDENVDKFVDAVAAVQGASGSDGSDAGVQRGRNGGAGICVSARLHLQERRIGRLPRCRNPKHQPIAAASVRHQIVSLWHLVHLKFRT